MKKNAKAQGLAESAIIGIIIIAIAIAVMPSIGNKLNSMIAMLMPTKNNVSTNATTLTASSPVDNLVSEFSKSIAALKRNNEDTAARVETTGIVGKIISLYNSTTDPELKAKLKAAFDSALSALATVDNVSMTQGQKDACLASPSSCSELMTITDFDWSAVNNASYLDSTICRNLDDPLPLNLSYDVSYVGADGTISVKQIFEAVYLQKEQFENYSNSLSDFLSTYMPTKFASDMFTGSGAQAESKIASYLTGKNSVLSKSKSTGLDLTP